jgi:hypothetical protein
MLTTQDSPRASSSSPTCRLRVKRNADFAAYEDARTRYTADEVDFILDRKYSINPSNGQASTISTTYTNS